MNNEFAYNPANIRIFYNFVSLQSEESNIMIRKAIYEDIPELMNIFRNARNIMRESGNLNQWTDGYPSEDIIRNDIGRGVTYVLRENGRIIATMAFIPGPDPTYAEIHGGEWLDSSPYYVIHRIAVLEPGHDAARKLIEWGFSRTDNIRIDTHQDNVIMRHVLDKMGFRRCGVIFLENGDPRDAYQKRQYKMKATRYETLYTQIQAVLSEEDDLIAKMADMAAMIHHEFGFWWTGFYRVLGSELVLGPFQGPVACIRIPFGKGVCGTAWKLQESIVVPDVEEFPGHIACSSESRSEIVIPVRKDGNIIGVLDIDSEVPDKFDDTDRIWLEKIAGLL